MGTPESDRPKRIFLHVGAPKTGTTYLQLVLFENRAALAGNGVLYPYEDLGQSFRSMQDFRGAEWDDMPADAFAGEWQVVADRCRAWHGHTVIVSNELLGGSAVERIGQGVASLVAEHDAATELHVVFTARDFARQLVSDWQEQVRHRHTVPLETFVDDLVELGLDAPAPFGEMFWGMHDAAVILDNWSRVVPRANIHLITVPQPGGPRDALWRRFCATVGLDPEAYDTTPSGTNTSMGVAEAEFLRRVNMRVESVPGPHYDLLARQFLGQQVLGSASGRLTLPPHRLPWAVERSRQLVEDLRAAGYHVVGDLEELMPREQGHHPYVSPTELSDEDLGPTAIRAAAALLTRGGELSARVVDLELRLAERERREAAPGPGDTAGEGRWWRRLGRRARRAGGRVRRFARRLLRRA